jgi:hypothetical protein
MEIKARTPKGNEMTIRSTENDVIAIAEHPTLGTMTGRCTGYCSAEFKGLGRLDGCDVEFPQGKSFAILTKAEWDGLWQAVRDAAPAHVKAWRTVEAARAEVERAESASYHDPARIIKARKAAEDALDRWEATYPEAAEARRAEIAKDAAEVQARRERDLANSFVGRGID